ncbi:MAG TPA: hypothetical protein VFV78_11225 [Vicinamibacterales bacterium]|nr:hypothetical protein [Vicinamibacterales bacterium]
MRTTLTLEPAVASRLRSEARRSGKAFKVIVNEALKRGLGMRQQAPPPVRFSVTPRAFGFKSGIDRDRLNQIVDEIDSEAFAAKAGR